MAHEWPEIVFSTDADRSVLSRAVTRGTLVRLTTGVYSGAINQSPAAIVQRHVLRIVANKLPGAVLVDWSARRAGVVNGVLSVDHPRSRPLVLPGVIVQPRQGPGHVAGDMELPGGLWMSSIPRQLLDNLHYTSATALRVMSATDIEVWIDELIAEYGEEGINKIRDDARQLAPVLHRTSEFRKLEKLISASLSTGTASHLQTEQLLARAAGQPFDARRIRTFESLAHDLISRAPEVIPALPVDSARRALLPFYEAYFSNYIEGTEFTLDEAAHIVFNQAVSIDRPADSHDIQGTFDIVSQEPTNARTAQTVDEFEELLISRHARLMSGRPEKLPGSFKTLPNRAGGTEFVLPELVRGTLRRGFTIGNEITNPFARATYMMFLVAEVHPFTDGNGRIARIMMNAELSRAGEVRIIIPTVFRNNYLSALRGATHNHNFAALYSVLHFARQWTARVDFSDRISAEHDLVRTNALRDSTQAESAGVRLMLP
jgi:hypothetical protein